MQGCITLACNLFILSYIFLRTGIIVFVRLANGKLNFLASLNWYHLSLRFATAIRRAIRWSHQSRRRRYCLWLLLNSVLKHYWSTFLIIHSIIFYLFVNLNLVLYNFSTTIFLNRYRSLNFHLLLWYCVIRWGCEVVKSASWSGQVRADILLGLCWA